MDAVFLRLLNMSMTASWLCLAVLLVRLLLKKAPKAISCALWALVGLRLLFPFSLESVLSLIPSAEPLPEDMLLSPTPTINSGIPVINEVVNPIISGFLTPHPGDSVNPLQVITTVASYVWIVGVAAMLIYMLVTYLRTRNKVTEAVKIEGSVYECDHVNTPFILGIIRPRIYLPSSMNEADRVFVIAHEKAHLRRLDHLWKPLGFLLLTVYWFNPLLWLGYILLCRDIELACDEKVIKELGTDIKKQYSETLINCSVPRRAISACPLAFGEVSVKGRIKSVLNYKKPAFWIILVAVVALIVTSVCFLTDPPSDDDSVIKNVPFDYCEWTGEYNEETYIAAVNEYVQSGKKPVSYYNKSVPTYNHVGPVLEKLSLTVSYPIKSCDNMWPALTSDTAEEEYQRRTFALIDTYVEGKTVYIDLGWLEKSSDYNPFTNFKEWSCVIVLKDMNNVKHYYYFRVDYTNWSFQSPGQSPAPLSYTSWNFKTAREFTLSEFENTKFVYNGSIYMIDRAGKETELISGMPILKAGFADLNKDGYPEFLGQVNIGIRSFIVVYDIRNDRFYRLDDRFSYDFYLTNENDTLSITIHDVRSSPIAKYNAIPVLVNRGDGYALELRNGSDVLYRSFTDGTHEGFLPEAIGSYVFSPDNHGDNDSFVSLYEDQTFQFAISRGLSYHGYGTYDIKDGYLILSTYDGKYTYVFEMHEDKLIYLKTKSNSYSGLRQIADGSEFIKQNTN